MELPHRATLVLLFICCTTINGMQKFDREPEYAIANPGETVVMLCRVHNLKGKCIWQKDGKPVGQYEGKYEWKDKPDDGDCSLRILSARADLDAAQWECQVTASSFDAEDALTSAPALLAVRVAPNAPQMEFNSMILPSESNMTLTTGRAVTVNCHSRNGNPVAHIKWFLGDMELTTHNQSNSTTGSKSKRWSALSTLTYTFDKSHHKAKLRCRAYHTAYAPNNFKETIATLDVHYGPQVSLVGNPTLDVLEASDSVSLRCVADANPPATVIWRRLGLTQPNGGDIFSFHEEIHFQPVTRADSATYSCEAKNDVGVSNLITVSLDVKYGPIISSVGPSVNEQLTVSLYESAALECQAVGNPPPTYQWLHRTLHDGQESIAVTSHERFLHITNVTYEFQGEYVCIATNTINGQERAVQSDAITVRVVGPPQVLSEVSSRYVSVERGEDAIISAIFCADPRPTKVSWRWASFQMEAGDGSGRYVAEALHKVTPTLPPLVSDDVDDNVMANEEATEFYDAVIDLEVDRYETTAFNRHAPRPLIEALPTAEAVASSPTVPPQTPHAIFTYPGKRDECYETRLRIQRVELNDGRHYYLTVENDKGTDSFYVTLNVKEPVPMATVIAVGIACLFVIIVVTLCLLYAYRSERCCFNRGSKSTDLESMKSDVESVHSSQCSSGNSVGAGSHISNNSREKITGKTLPHVSAIQNPAPVGPPPLPPCGPYKTNIKLKGPDWGSSSPTISY